MIKLAVNSCLGRAGTKIANLALFVIFLLQLFLFTSFAMAKNISDEPSVDTNFTEGIDSVIERILNKDYRTAQEILNAALTANKFDFQLNCAKEILNEFFKGTLKEEYLEHFFKGLSYHRNNEFNKSIDEFQKAISINNNYPQAYLFLGIEYLSLNKPKDALPFFEKCIELSSEYPQSYWGLASVYGNLNDVQKEKYYLVISKNLFTKAGNARALEGINRQLYKLETKNPSFIKAKGLYEEGLNIAKHGNINDALLKFNNTLKYDYSFAEAHHDLAGCYSILGKSKEAIKELEIAVLLAPYNWTSYQLDLGHLYLEQKMWDKAIQQLNILWQIDFQAAQILESDILTVRSQKLDLNEINSKGEHLLLSSLKLTDDELKASKLLEEALEKIKNINADSSEEAKKLLIEGTKFEAKRNICTSYLARLYANEKDFKSCAKALESFLKKNPNDAQILSMLANTYLSLEKYTNARNTFDKIKKIDDIIYKTMRHWVDITDLKFIKGRVDNNDKTSD